MNLEEIRNQIDTVDAELAQLLEQRMGLVNQASSYKKTVGKAVFDPKREEKVLEKVASLVKNKDFEATILAVFSDIMKNSRDYQNQKIGQ